MKKTIQIKHMVCPRCIRAVNDELSALRLKVLSVELGTATYMEDESVSIADIEAVLKKQGFELIRNSEEELVEQVKTALIALIHHAGQTPEPINYSDYLADKIGKSYGYLSKVFSQHYRKTIERYIILLKVEKAKELIEYDQSSFAEIAYSLGYKNPTHLAQQFKEVAGVTMGEYKKRYKEIGRKTLDTI